MWGAIRIFYSFSTMYQLLTYSATAESIKFGFLINGHHSCPINGQLLKVKQIGLRWGHLYDFLIYKALREEA